ncbi:NAD(P)-binding protein [Tilletiaria anomala UBC 951]|uniref:NAD(P)-binding protein n=1 Tax=Tilletiaria anomala (strain ATCC 24038 / CBS 436.72 / UBC 951) TaxID=1037660 RepID=A0A066W1C6_TILAU|nr:NAD(P)-binding protein [Tilletiaria anomala UBC 951]KDN47546.1 NAD(P)-binding protein [Tilletiaria anomala UBC 951]
MANAPPTHEAHFVIGGNGFLGSSIVRLLQARGEPSVHIFDLSQPLVPVEKVSYHVGDITKLDSLKRALSDASNQNVSSTVSAAKGRGEVVIYHTASPVAGLAKELYEKVNVQGTENVIKAGKELGIRKLIFTSSAGVLFTGQDLINVDERLPYPEVPLDAYNDTKARAEDAVLKANDSESSTGLRTVALRPAGIFGVNDRQALPGFFQVLATGRANMQIGDNENLFDWTYVDNVAHAHLLAADKLGEEIRQGKAASYASERLGYEHLSEKIMAPEEAKRYRSVPTSESRPSPPGATDYAASLPSTLVISEENPLNERPLLRNKFDPFFHHVNPEITSVNNPLPESTETNLACEHLEVSGQAFFITNGQPIPFWDFPRALWAAVGTVVPKEKTWKLSKGVGLFLASAAEWGCWVMGKQPLFTKYKVTYTACARYYNIEKARRLLGYEPIVGLEEGIRRSVQWWKESHPELVQKS